MAMMSPYQAFPLNHLTFQGAVTDFDMTTVRYNLVRLLEDGDISYTDNDTGTVYTFTGLTAGDDYVISGAAATLTSTGAVLIS